MEDFASRFIRGFQAGNQQKQQKQAELERAEDRKLEKVLLQHKLRTMGIEEKLQKRQAQLSAHSQRDGQPESSFPVSEAGFEAQPNAAPSMFGGMKLPGQSFGLEAKREIAPSLISGVEEYGIPDTNLMPQTAEQKMAAEAARARATPRMFRPGDRLMANGETIAENPAAPRAANPPALGSFEDYTVRYAAASGITPEALTPAQIEDARKRYQQSDDRPRITVNAGPRSLTPNAKLKETRSLRNDFVRESAAARSVSVQLNLMRAAMNAVRKGAAAPGSQGVLVTFQKILDPNSVVRESEYARSASGQSLMSRLEGQLMKIQQGGAGVPADELQKFVTLAEEFATNQSDAANEAKLQIEQIATEYGINPKHVTTDISVKPEGGSVKMRAPDGSVRDVPADQVAHFKAKGAVVVK